eukprot:Skav219495  [mRNA]  locus=scaffold937:68215:68925:+ [translate_table: standard]
MPPKHLHALILRILRQLGEKIREEANAAEDYGPTQSLWIGQGGKHCHRTTLRETSYENILSWNSLAD